MWGIGHAQAERAANPGQPLYGWSTVLDASLKPETYERASTILDKYANNTESIEAPFIPNENDSRYGLSDDYFWIQKGELWGLVRTPLKDGDYIFFEKIAK
tara:strand:+ start:238 stop:540 length:303 start_codon:yes stop_codon:yes gene_type:complete